MMKSIIILDCLLALILTSCLGKPCDKVTEKDIVGIYVPLSSKTNDKQYVEIFKDGRFYVLYCNEDIIIEDWGKWEQLNGCHILLNGFRWFNSFPEDTIKGGASFNWINGKLSLGEDAYSFKKVHRKPKLNCYKESGENIIGIYTSLNPDNKNRQYIQAFEDGRFCMRYCHEGTIVDDWGEWEYQGEKHFLFHNIRWIDSSPEDTIKRTVSFELKKKRLAPEGNHFSFKRVERKPKLNCDK